MFKSWFAHLQQKQKLLVTRMVALNNHYGNKKSSSLGEKRDITNKQEANGNVNSPSMNNSSGVGNSCGQSGRNRNNGPYD